MRARTALQNALCMATPISSPTVYVPYICGAIELRIGTFAWFLCAELISNRSSLLTELMLFQPPGTRLSAFGSSQPVPPLADSSDTQTTFFRFRSPPITDRLSPDPAIEQSSCGTPWATASSPLRRRDTLTGFRAFDSAQTLKTQSSSVADGTSLSR